MVDFAEDNLDPDLPTHFNTANEWILRNVTVGGSPVAPLYDDNGNMIDDAEDYVYKYDPWNRLVSISTTGGSPTLVAEYRYNGLGQRISESDGTDTEYLVYDDSWQLIARFDGASSKYTEEILYNHAGLDGLGGSSAMDSVILRRTYLTTGSPQTEDKCWYILQNWRNDPAVTLTDAGVQVERVRFSPYGEAFGIPSGDTDFNGEATLAEEILLSNWESIPLAYRAYADINLDGVIDAADAAAASGATMGRGVLSHVSSKIGYAGYTRDAYVTTLSHVRHRVYKSDLGRWLQRDPAGYVDGPSLYEYAMGAPVRHRDPMGLAVDWDGPSGPAGGGSPEAKGCDWDDWRSPDYQVPNKRVPPTHIKPPPGYPYPWNPDRLPEWISPYTTPEDLCRYKANLESYYVEQGSTYSISCIREAREAAVLCCENAKHLMMPSCKSVFHQTLSDCHTRPHAPAPQPSPTNTAQPSQPSPIKHVGPPSDRTVPPVCATPCIMVAPGQYIPQTTFSLVHCLNCCDLACKNTKHPARDIELCGAWCVHLAGG